ncbi:MAG: hypothetical protein JWN67_3468 [Actinomycetia bacterium]|nr:hypothetical protein [Actinomycetes bacterium]
MVEVPIGRAHAILLGDPTGIVRPSGVSAIGRSVDLEVGPARRRDEEVLVPVHVRSLGGGPFRELAADLTVVAAGEGARVELRGTYRWDGRGDGYGGGVLAHRVARWLANDLVHGVGERLVERARAGEVVG